MKYFMGRKGEPYTIRFPSRKFIDDLKPLADAKKFSVNKFVVDLCEQAISQQEPNILDGQPLNPRKVGDEDTMYQAIKDIANVERDMSGLKQEMAEMKKTQNEILTLLKKAKGAAA